MLSYLGSFSNSFSLAVVLWPILSAVLTLPILAGMYHRHHRLRATAVLVAYLCVLYALGLATFTLYPMPDNPAAYCATHSHTPQLHVIRFMSDLQTGGKSAVLQLLFNIALFVPLGFALKRWAKWSFWAVLPVGFLTSLLIECSQLTGVWGIYPCAYRQFDVDDLLMNTLGAVCGCIVAWIYGLLDPVEQSADPDEINTSPGLLHRAVTLVLDMIFVWVLTLVLTMGFIFLFQKTSTPLPNGDFLFLGVALPVSVSDVAARVISVLVFLVFELWIPMRHNGQTLGGMFTHMSAETEVRSGGRRASFYALRTLVLFAATQLYATGWAEVGMVVVIVLVVFWLIFRCAPYDLV